MVHRNRHNYRLCRPFSPLTCLSRLRVSRCFALALASGWRHGNISEQL